MGLLAAGAMAGLGQAGGQAANTLLRAELERDEREWILNRQQELKIAEENRIEAKDAAKRQAFSTELDALRGGKIKPDMDNLSQARKTYETAEMDDADRQRGLLAVTEAEDRIKSSRPKLSSGEIADAALKSGVINGKDYTGMLKSDGANEVKLAIAEGRIQQLQDYLQFKRDKLATDDETKRRGQDMRAETAASGQASKSEQADKNRSAYGQTGNKEWQSTIKAYDNEFESKNAMGEKEFDAVGKSAFARMLEINRERGAKPGEAASGALAAIRALRKQASSPDGTIDHDKYEALVGAMFKRMK